MAKQNCWEFMKCEREPGGAKVHELGVCPATIFTAADGFCGGKNGGRACTYITGTFCTGLVEGTHEEKQKDCGKCDFYRILRREHKAEITILSFQRYVKETTQRARRSGEI